MRQNKQGGGGGVDKNGVEGLGALGMDHKRMRETAPEDEV